MYGCRKKRKIKDDTMVWDLSSGGMELWSLGMGVGGQFLGSTGLV